MAAMDRKGVAELLHVSERSVRNWERGTARVPYSAFRLLRIASGFAVPGGGWEGWTIRKGLLWSPAGQAFEPWAMGYLSLVFSMARQWSIEHGGDGVPLSTACPLPDRRMTALPADSARPLRGRGKGGGLASVDRCGQQSRAPRGEPHQSPRLVIRGETLAPELCAPNEINGLRKEGLTTAYTNL